MPCCSANNGQLFIPLTIRLQNNKRLLQQLYIEYRIILIIGGSGPKGLKKSLELKDASSNVSEILCQVSSDPPHLEKVLTADSIAE